MIFFIHVFFLCVQQILLVIVDSGQTQDRGPYTALATVAQQLQANGINSYALGVGPAAKDQDLKDIASKPSNVFKATVNTLPAVRQKIGDAWLGYLRGM